MKKRSIGMMIVLTLVTFGIYMLVWYISFQSELKDKTGEGFGGGMHLIMTIITFGIYYIYWQYAAGKRVAKLGGPDRSVMYLVLCFVGLLFINPFLMQSDVNNLIKE